MTYILLDESGDLGLSFNRGSSRYFVITILITKNKRQMDRLARQVYKKIINKHYKKNMLHAYQQNEITRKRLLNLVIKINFQIFSIIIDKRNFTHDLDTSKSDLYSKLVGKLLNTALQTKEILNKDKFILIASKRETSTFLNNKFIKDVEFRLLEKRVNIKIEIKTPAEEKSLQIIDFISWSIYRKHELGDNKYHDIIKSKIINESIYK